MERRTKVPGFQRWVVKIGSALLTNDGKGLDLAAIGEWVDQMARLRGHGIELLLVSSGSVAAGMTRLGWVDRPGSMHELQAAAAVGQMGLVQTYESHFKRHDTLTAQVLLTHDDLSDRRRYLNARSTLTTLLRLGVVPVINENDTVVTDEIRFGDNDTLGALVANLVEADLLVILTDQKGLFTANPSTDPDAVLISESAANNPELPAMAAGGMGRLGRGGMSTKVKAAVLAARSGAHTLIVGGREPDVLPRLLAGEPLGTLLWPEQGRWVARKQWLAGHLQTRGVLHLDAGAVRVLRESGKSLLSVGVTRVEGRFVRGEMVRCVDEQGNDVARGLVNYGADEAARIAGRPSREIESILGYVDEPELVNRDNLVLV
ncbi:glutamate 5-kinase [Aestuariirhabdus litorea]|uniref:Glutamate 5-kinase n=1 Tax=Aestuariirhabdus litorea TaxID=2528527 RepID=A0A3P3VLN9_9GAMM|nr:glutamate 5-kinase [Aestuariirhabdus litorea]RRJ83247.1 glutamate 5-kinase [Aestuariirhabdus litorea]RWW93405.1 glutamate 5-kinase [Endozoicomonadaceae bacterium GTF-13]